MGNNIYNSNAHRIELAEVNYGLHIQVDTGQYPELRIYENVFAIHFIFWYFHHNSLAHNKLYETSSFNLLGYTSISFPDPHAQYTNAVKIMYIHALAFHRHPHIHL